MVQVVRTAWNANRHRLAAGFLLSTSVFLFLMFANWSNGHRRIEAQKASGLSSGAWYLPLASQRNGILSSFRSSEDAQTGMDEAYGTLGGVPGGFDAISATSQHSSPDS